MRARIQGDVEKPRPGDVDGSDPGRTDEPPPQHLGDPRGGPWAPPPSELQRDIRGVIPAPGPRRGLHLHPLRHRRHTARRPRRHDARCAAQCGRAGRVSRHQRMGGGGCPREPVSPFGRPAAPPYPRPAPTGQPKTSASRWAPQPAQHHRAPPPQQPLASSAAPRASPARRARRASPERRPRPAPAPGPPPPACRH